MNLQETKKKHGEEMSALFHDYGFFAFNSEQMKAGLDKVQASPERKVFHVAAGSYLLFEKKPDLIAMMERHKKELAAARKDQKDLKENLVREFINHECHLGGDYQLACDVLGFTPADNMRLYKAARTEFFERIKNV